MKKILITALVALALSACALKPSTPEERYYVLNGGVVAAGEATKKWVTLCIAKPAVHPCHGKFGKINAATKALNNTLKEADRVFVAKDAQYYDLALTTAQNALQALSVLVDEKEVQ